jgi:hypothetical protein
MKFTVDDGQELIAGDDEGEDSHRISFVIRKGIRPSSNPVE